MDNNVTFSLNRPLGFSMLRYWDENHITILPDILSIAGCYSDQMYTGVTKILDIEVTPSKNHN